MSTSKTVNITNGKVLNYTITADGYKTVHGSELITEDRTGANAININMIPLTNTKDGVYSLGDRIGGIASFVCYQNVKDPNTLENKTIAVFVLDGQYRPYWAPGNSWTGNTVSGLPGYSDATNALNSTVSGTYSTDYILNNYSNPGSGYVFAYYFWLARQQATIRVAGTDYSSQVPNLYCLNQIYQNRVALDEVDPTIKLSTYSNYNLTTWCPNWRNSSYKYTYAMSASLYNGTNGSTGSTSSPWMKHTNGSYTNNESYQYFNWWCIPVFEIPVEYMPTDA